MRKILGSIIGFVLPIFHWVRPHSILEWIGLISLSHEIDEWGKAMTPISHLLGYWPFALGLGIIIWANWDSIKEGYLKGWKFMNQKLGKRRKNELVNGNPSTKQEVAKSGEAPTVGISVEGSNRGSIDGNLVHGFEKGIDVKNSNDVPVTRNIVIGPDRPRSSNKT